MFSNSADPHHILFTDAESPYQLKPTYRNYLDYLGHFQRQGGGLEVFPEIPTTAVQFVNPNNTLRTSTLHLEPPIFQII